MYCIWLMIPSCTKFSSLKEDIMVFCTLQIKDHWRIISMWEAGQTQTVIARWFGINQSQVKWLIAKYRETNDVTDRPRSGRPILSSAANDRVLVQSAVVILRLLVLNFISSDEILMFVPVPGLLTGDLTRPLDIFDAWSLTQWCAVGHWQTSLEL